MKVQAWTIYVAGIDWKEHIDGEPIEDCSTIVDIPDNLLASAREARRKLRNVESEIREIVCAKIGENQGLKPI